MGVGIQFYSWAHEKEYATSRVEKEVYPEHSFPPTLGVSWLYYSLSAMNKHGDPTLVRTRGRVVKVDTESGLILTDLNEVLMRG